MTPTSTPTHQLCCAHALRELQTVADAGHRMPDWCWATQAADALVAMQTPGGRGDRRRVPASIDPDVLAEQVRALPLGRTDRPHPDRRALRPRS